LLDVADRIRRLELETVRNLAMAFHEIRKLNAQVKRTAERMCMAERPDEPDRASSDLVRVWKSAELMSRQFDIVEILANEDLAKIEPNTISQIYPLFDKCVRILRFRPGANRLFITQSDPNYRPEVWVSDKTIAIIPTVLIDNALRYGVPGTPVTVRVDPEGELCKVSVSNVAPGSRVLSASIFEKGVRGDTTKEGSGNGLYLARLVAEQHKTRIEVENAPQADGTVVHSFVVRFQPVKRR
jgi:light-regulated signal transduction histidine kinase (bacteriophytochrome)